VSPALHRSLAGAVVMTVLAGAPLAASAAAQKPRHDLVVQAKEIGGDDSSRFKLFGRVSTFPGQELRVERKVNKGPFEAWSTDTTSADKGKFSIRVYGGKRGSTICYRVVVPATPDHRRTQGQRWCIETEA
jgi:hypothetical protein